MTNAFLLTEAKTDSSVYNLDEQFLYACYLVNEIFIKNLSDLNENNQFVLEEGLWDKVKGAGSFAKKFATTGNVGQAKQAYSSTNVSSMQKSFEDKIGGILANIKKADTTNSLKLGNDLGGIPIKQKTGAIQAATSKAFEFAVTKFLTGIENVANKSKLAVKNPQQTVDSLVNKIKPNLTIPQDKHGIDALKELVKNNPKYTNIVIGVLVNLSKMVGGATFGPIGGVATGAVIGLIARTLSGKLQGETYGQAFKKALVVTSASMAIGSLVKGVVSGLSGHGVGSGMKGYFTGAPSVGDATSDGTPQDVAGGGNVPQSTTDGDSVTQNGHEYVTKITPSDNINSALGKIDKTFRPDDNTRMGADMNLSNIESQQPNSVLGKLITANIPAQDASGNYVPTHMGRLGHNFKIALRNALEKVNPADQKNLIQILQKDPNAIISVMDKLTAGDVMHDKYVAFAKDRVANLFNKGSVKESVIIPISILSEITGNPNAGGNQINTYKKELADTITKYIQDLSKQNNIQGKNTKELLDNLGKNQSTKDVALKLTNLWKSIQQNKGLKGSFPSTVTSAGGQPTPQQPATAKPTATKPGAPTATKPVAPTATKPGAPTATKPVAPTATKSGAPATGSQQRSAPYAQITKIADTFISDITKTMLDLKKTTQNKDLKDYIGNIKLNVLFEFTTNPATGLAPGQPPPTQPVKPTAKPTVKKPQPKKAVKKPTVESDKLNKRFNQFFIDIANSLKIPTSGQKTVSIQKLVMADKTITDAEKEKIKKFALTVANVIKNIQQIEQSQ